MCIPPLARCTLSHRDSYTTASSTGTIYQRHSQQSFLTRTSAVEICSVMGACHLRAPVSCKIRPSGCLMRKDTR